MTRWRAVLVVVAAVGLVASCTSGAVGPTVPTGTTGGLYRDPAGWFIRVEPGWRVVPFRFSARGVSAVGAQISNVRLPYPIAEPGAPIQAGGLTLPRRGIALVIGTDHDPRLVRQVPLLTPPLSYPTGWNVGSSTGEDPSMDAAWFHAGPGEPVFIATLKVDPSAWDHRADIRAVTRMIESVSF